MASTKKTQTPRRPKTTPDAPLRAPRAVRRAAKAAPATMVQPLQSRTKAQPASAPSGKLGVIVEMMRRPEGATIAQMSEVTDWLPHSVRGALAGALKKKHKLTVTSEKTDTGRVYRMPPLAAAKQAPASE